MRMSRGDAQSYLFLHIKTHHHPVFMLIFILQEIYCISKIKSSCSESHNVHQDKANNKVSFFLIIITSMQRVSVLQRKD